MSDEIKQNFLSTATWIRAAFMILFVLIYSITKIVIGAVVIFQFFSNLLFGTSNDKLLTFGNSLGRFIYDIILFLTYNTEDKPFPFGDWPASNASGPSIDKKKTKATQKKPSQSDES